MEKKHLLINQSFFNFYSNQMGMAIAMKVTLSTVTPVYGGEKYLRQLVVEINELRETWKQEDAPIQLVESIFVDDGAIDTSPAVLGELAKTYPWITPITLSRNVGQHAATVAGICHSSGDWVVTLDEDLQHKPGDVLQLLIKAMETDSDVAYAQPRTPAHGGSWRDRGSVWTKAILAKLTATPQIKAFNSFRLIRGTIARAAASSSSSQTYLDIAISWFTNSYVTVPMDMEDERFLVSKKSGYELGQLIRHARHLLVSSSIDIASKGLVVGGIAVLIAAVIAVMVLLQKIFYPELIDAVGWASLVSIVTFFSGVIIVLACIALEYLHVLVLIQLGKPTFFTIDRDSDHVIKKWLEDCGKHE